VPRLERRAIGLGWRRNERAVGCKYPKWPERVNIIQKVCMMPFMLITGLSVLSVSAGLPAETVVGGIRPWMGRGSPEWQEPSL
jgi:hypothetical protein